MSLLAAAPVALLLGLMLGLRWSAARAGLVTLVATTAIAVGAFGAGTFDGPALAGGVTAETGFTALGILWIIGPALGIHYVQQASGATVTLRDAMARLAPDPRLAALLVAWFFALFLEGAAGFGASVALAAPFLVGAGLPPAVAVVAALLGHAVGVSFGAVGTPVFAQTVVTALSPLEIARVTGAYHSLLGGLLLIAMVAVVARATPASIVRGPRLVVWTIVAGTTFFVPFTLLSRHVGPELPTLAGAMLGGIAFVALISWARAAPRRAAHSARPVGHAAVGHGPGAPVGRMAVARAAAPYLALIVLVLVTRIVPPVRESTQVWQWRWTLADSFGGTIAPLHHPGSLLLAAFVIGFAVQRVRPQQVRGAFVQATVALAPVTVALVAMIGIARLMVHAGMVEALAGDLARTAGSAWPLLAPFVGALGTFVTGSATASNILFTDLQVATARQASLPIPPIVGAQGMGAAVGNIICPHNIVAASATVGLTGSEASVMRRTFPVVLAYLVMGGLLAIVWA